MELEEMKNLWQKHDKAIAENRMLNEKVLNELLQHKSGGPLRKLRNVEYYGTASCILLLMVFLIMMGRAWASPAATICYFILVLGVTYSIVAGIYKIKLLSAIDFSGSALTDVAYKVQRFRLIVSQERLWGMLFVPVGVCCAYIFINKMPVAELVEQLPRIIIGSVAGIGIGLLLYKSMYFDNIVHIQRNIEEIKSFRHEVA